MVSVEQVQGWAKQLEGLHQRIAGRFARAEPRERVLAYLKALLSPIERKNGWQVAEQMGEATPDGVQRLLNGAEWNAEEIRDDLRTYVVERLGDPEAVMVLDETGFLKKGTKSAGVQRQYSGTAGRIDNCQIGVFLCYASAKGTTLLDRALYLPKDWIISSERRREAGIPQETSFATKPELARQMLSRARTAGVPFRWVTGDCIYGADRALRFELEQERTWFVLEVSCKEKLWFGGPTYHRADALAEEISPEHWHCLSAGSGTKGERLYDWALIELWRLQLTRQEKHWGHYLLVRRRRDNDQELAYFVVFCPREQANLPTLTRVAGSRWNIEICFESAKGECGLDQYEVRKWDAWHRHITLSMLAHAFLTDMRWTARQDDPQQKGALSID